jgi:hypothetical protein
MSSAIATHVSYTAIAGSGATASIADTEPKLAHKRITTCGDWLTSQELSCLT